jgi:hypothetical protein
MVRRAVAGAGAAACFAFLAACGANHFVQRGADLYGAGRYVEADEVFERSEPRMAHASASQRAAFAAYRGATFIALGDLRHAQEWLGLASAIESNRPGTLRPEERAFLDGAWSAYARHVAAGATTPAAATTAIASSSQVPSPNTETIPPAVNQPVRERALVPQ